MLKKYSLFKMSIGKELTNELIHKVYQLKSKGMSKKYITNVIYKS